MPGHIVVWTVYDHPSDFPDCFIARRAEIHGGGTTVMTGDIIRSNALKDIRTALRRIGLVQFARQEMDDEGIIEVWL